jgi:GTP-binding protein
MVNAARQTVAIVGRPNVGKSTLFNRILGRRQAVVDDMSGVTRDRLVEEADWAGTRFFLTDTGGLLPEASRGMDARVRRQVEAALELATVVLFIVDVESGVTALDEQIAGAVRRTGRPVFLVVNKVDSERREIDAHDFARLGVGEPHSVSALHGRSIGDLLDAVVAKLPAATRESAAGARALEVGIRVAVVGRPNVGKSSLVNRLLCEERMIVDERPGTTRDAVDSSCVLAGEHFTFIDTAGLRRRTRIDTRTEYYATVRAVQAIDRADVAVLMLDASEPFGRQDYRIASLISGEHKPAVLLFNKWDLVEKETMTSKRMEDAFREHAGELVYAPSLFVSALEGQRLHRLPKLLRHVHDEARRQWGQAELTRVLEVAVRNVPPPAPPSRRQEFRGAVQRGVKPIRFHIEASQPEAVPIHYRRYLERRFREELALTHAPIVLRFVRPRRRRRTVAAGARPARARVRERSEGANGSDRDE